MSQLDRLESQSMSGVPMRRKVFAPVPTPPLPTPTPTPPPQADAASPTTTEIFVQLANLLAASNEKLASTIGTALTSRPQVTAAQRKTVKLDFAYGGDGAVIGATSSDGTNSGQLAFTRSNGFIDTATVSSNGTLWNLAFTRADGKLSVSASPQ